VPDPDRSPSRAVWVPQATVFVSSFCIMVIELVAGRIISRHLGSSLYTWTSVIGVVLAGIAVGNWLGGLLADRRRPAPALSVLFLASSAACLTTTVLNQTVGNWLFLWMLPWSLRVGTHVAIVFLAPSLLLGMISPIAAKMALDRGRSTGRTIGGVYAWGVVGSIAGTFATGFYLIAAFGTAAVVWSVAGVLAAMALLFGAASWRSWAWAAVLAFLAIPGLGDWAWARSLGESLSLRAKHDPDILYVDDSQYSHIEVRRADEGVDRRELFLDKLLHSTIDMNHPSTLQYPYERVYGAVTRALGAGRDSLGTLTIGGGGYVFPRYLEDTWPGSRTEVVEIDPAVTRAAILALGLPERHGLELHHEDGRVFLRRQVERKRRGEAVPLYDFLYLDVFNDFSVPYQVTTRECLELVDQLLAPGGAFLMNMVDMLASGQFVGSMVATMETVFPDVAVFVEGRWQNHSDDFRDTFILVGTHRPIDTAAIARGYDERFGLHELTGDERRSLQRKCGGRILTDDWAPVENLLAPVVRASSNDMAAARIVDRGFAELNAGHPDEALREAQRALRFGEDRDTTHELMANAYFLQKRWNEAIRHYELSIRARPDRPAVRNNHGAALLQAGRVEDAIREFEATLRLDPDHARARENLERARAILQRRSQVRESPTGS
jgi:spermidine synthase